MALTTTVDTFEYKGQRVTVFQRGAPPHCDYGYEYGKVWGVGQRSASEAASAARYAIDLGVGVKREKH